MAFKSYEELINMASQNPKRATELVQKAQKTSTPVVSSENSGYSNNPRMSALKRAVKKSTTAQDNSVVEARKNLGRYYNG